jgi:hypothetical protein
MNGRVELALKCHRATIGLPACYVRLLKTMIFPRLTLDDRKAIKSVQKALSSYDTYPILQLIWKESAFVTEGELKNQKLRRFFAEESLTCHGLATVLAGTVDRIPAMNKRLAAIIRAALIYGLVEEKQISRTKILIRATDLLNDFMLTLSDEQYAFLDEELKPGNNGSDGS